MESYEILIGTYEAFVLGYKCVDGQLRTSFANHAHCGSVRSIAAGDKYLVTAGSDENVKIFNLRNRTEHGTLTHADGVINQMKFYDRKHLITAAEDGNICILKATSGWSVEKTLCKHQGGVTDFSVHPSGKLMLSVAKDGKMVTWNLIKGRHAFVTNLKGSLADFVEWSPSGSHYVVGFFKRIDVYTISDAKIHFSITDIESRAAGVVFLDEATLAVASGPRVHLYSMVSSDLIDSVDLYEAESRIRCVSLVENQFLVTASNSGIVKVHSILKNGGKFKFKEELKIDSKCRPTCMVVHKVPEILIEKESKIKKKRSISSSKISFNEPEKATRKGHTSKKARLVVEDEKEKNKTVK